MKITHQTFRNFHSNILRNLVVILCIIKMYILSYKLFKEKILSAQKGKIINIKGHLKPSTACATCKCCIKKATGQIKNAFTKGHYVLLYNSMGHYVLLYNSTGHYVLLCSSTGHYVL